MDGVDLLFVAGAFFFAAFVKGITGLGFSTTALPFLVLAIGLKATLPLLIIPSVSSNLIVMRDAGHFRLVLRRFWPLYVAALPGIGTGLFLLAWLDPGISTAVLGVVLMLYCLFALARPDFSISAGLARLLAIPTGLITGLFNGLTGSQVMPVLPYLLSLRLPPNEFVQAINISFTLSSLVMAVGLAKLGLLTVEVAAISFAGLLPVYLGVKLGARVRDRLPPESFRTAVLIVLLLLGASLVVRLLL